MWNVESRLHETTSTFYKNRAIRWEKSSVFTYNPFDYKTFEKSTFYCRLQNYRYEVKPVVSYRSQKINDPVKYEKDQEKRLQCK